MLSVDAHIPIKREIKLRLGICHDSHGTSPCELTSHWNSMQLASWMRFPGENSLSRLRYSRQTYSFLFHWILKRIIFVMRAEGTYFVNKCLRIVVLKQRHIAVNSACMSIKKSELEINMTIPVFVKKNFFQEYPFNGFLTFGKKFSKTFPQFS